MQSYLGTGNPNNQLKSALSLSPPRQGSVTSGEIKCTVGASRVIGSGSVKMQIDNARLDTSDQEILYAFRRDPDFQMVEPQSTIPS